MRSHPLYNKYIFYCEHILVNKIGALSMYRISESSFNEFIHRYEKEYKFSDKIDDLYKRKSRDIKIESIQGIPPN